jgi:putative transposase
MQHYISRSHQPPSSQHSMSNLGTGAHYAPANAPQHKAIAERLFKFISDTAIRQS